ncbi:carbohydrate ABC transporter permease [Thermoactinospora rubra]|uniref:carbohydrate ABC transporter permease n=1 Tax=Thermoactinospora rubra TaxID=1088767 RepID=UPI000A10CD07|nr:sugar ABC transporter permease [Thermoactinospora rubra]
MTKTFTGPDARRPALPASPSRRRRRPAAPRGRFLTAFAFVLPALVLFVLLVLAPILIAAYLSLYRWNGVGPPTNFIGLDNYLRAFRHQIFLGDLRNLLIIVALSLLVQLPISLGLALLLNRKIRGRAFYRVMFFAPYVISEAITAVLFSLILSPESGMANQLLSAFGMEGWPWLSDPDTVMISLFLVITWKYFGFHMIIYMAGLQGIPKELTEAASIDGANPWNVFRHVTLPLLAPTIRISVFLSVIGAIQLFDLVWILTGGGPSHASETLAVTMYDYGFRRTQIGYASAISVLMFLLALVFALGYQRTVMRRDVQGALTTMGGGR